MRLVLIARKPFQDIMLIKCVLVHAVHNYLGKTKHLLIPVEGSPEKIQKELTTVVSSWERKGGQWAEICLLLCGIPFRNPSIFPIHKVNTHKIEETLRAG